MSTWYIGTIGFSYKDWVGPFYPPGITQKGYLPYYAKIFNTVEVNTTFHAIPRQSMVQSWVDASPPDFKFSFKTPKSITHELGLKGAKNLMMEFIDLLEPLEEKCGPILLQLPPTFSQENITIVGEFLESLPINHNYAIEFRHPSWYNKKTHDLLMKYHVCWAAIDYPNLPNEMIITTNFIYIRWIGINNLYHIHTHERIDKTEQLKDWLENIKSIASQVDNIYGYFNNDYAGFAAGTGIRFKQIAGLSDFDNGVPYQDRFL